MLAYSGSIRVPAPRTVVKSIALREPVFIGGWAEFEDVTFGPGSYVKRGNTLQSWNRSPATDAASIPTDFVSLDVQACDVVFKGCIFEGAGLPFTDGAESQVCPGAFYSGFSQFSRIFMQECAFVDCPTWAVYMDDLGCGLWMLDCRVINSVGVLIGGGRGHRIEGLKMRNSAKGLMIDNRFSEAAVPGGRGCADAFKANGRLAVEISQCLAVSMDVANSIAASRAVGYATGGESIGLDTDGPSSMAGFSGWSVR